MFCNKCGTSLPDDSCFCSKCGNRLMFEEPTVEPVIDGGTICDVLLVSYNRPDRLKLIKFLKEELRYTMQEAMDFLDKEPRIIRDIDYAEAVYVKAQLEQTGAVAEIHFSNNGL